MLNVKCTHEKCHYLIEEKSLFTITVLISHRFFKLVLLSANPVPICAPFLQQLKQQRDKLKQYQKKITLQLEKERLLAKQLLKDGKKE